MATRRLDSSPRILPLYARAVAPLLPGASRLPWVAGAAREVPDLRLTLSRVPIDPERVARYEDVCGFTARGHVPATYVHVLAFPLHLALMADGSFPFPAIGLVHVANQIVQHRTIEHAEQLDLEVRATPLEPHRRGRTFSIASTAHVDGELVWEETSTMLRRGGASSSGPGSREDGSSAPESSDGESGPSAPESSAGGEQWRLAGDLGRRYAAVSGDRNPIHLHALTARALGFPCAIAHGMWTKARCLAALQDAHADLRQGAFAIDVSFRRAILLPAMVRFDSVAEADDVSFGVREAASEGIHLVGRLRPLHGGSPANTSLQQEEAQ
jgi:acyl dehydratase